MNKSMAMQAFAIAAQIPSSSANTGAVIHCEACAMLLRERAQPPLITPRIS